MNKEIKAIGKALEKYRIKNKDVCIICSVIAFDKGGDVKNDRYWTMGDKKVLMIDIKELGKIIKSMKDD